MKNLFYLFITLFSITIYSCSNDDLNSSDSIMEDIEVVKVGDYITSTRTLIPESDYDLSVLKFKNETVYSQTLQKVKEMGVEQKRGLFTELGFDGAYTLRKEADNELDIIFDIDDDNEFMSAYNEFKSKYSASFTFNDVDTYDLSPYLTFTDDNLELLGNINGYVIIGNQIIAPDKKFPTFTVFDNEEDFEEVADGIYLKKEVMTRNNFPGEIKGDFRGFGGVTAMIKQGKYQSTMSIGYENGINFCPIAVRYASQKKKKLWKRRHEATYSATVGLPSGRYGAHVPVPYEEIHVGLPVPLSALGKKPTIEMINFTSGCCDKVEHNQTFKIELPYN